MNPTNRILSSLAAAAALGLAATLVAHAADKPKYTIEEVMKDLHKGDDALCKKVAKGEGTKDDFKKLVQYYTALPLQEPPKGDAKEWKEKATKLLDAAKALEAGKPDALEHYKTAVNCKSCHTAFKPD